MNMKNRRIFKSVVKGENFITPYLIDYFGDGKNIVIELTTTDDATKRVFGPLYGVTVVRNENGKWVHDTDASQPFKSRVAAMEYIESLQRR